MGLPLYARKFPNLVMDQNGPIDSGEWTVSKARSSSLVHREEAWQYAMSAYQNGHLPRFRAVEKLVFGLLDKVLQSLDLEREDPKYTLQLILGYLVYSSQTNESIRSIKYAIQHRLRTEDVMSGSNIRHLPDGFRLGDLEENLFEANLNLIQKALDLGLMKDPLHTSYDLTKIQTPEGHDIEGDLADEADRFVIGALAITEEEYELIVGLEILRNKSDRSESMEYFLEEFKKVYDIRAVILTDRGFNGVRDIKAAATAWRYIIHLNQNVNNDIIEELDSQLADSQTADTIGGYEDLHKEVTAVGYERDDSDPGINGQRRYFHTSYAPSDGRIRRINVVYEQRNKIDTMFGEIKNRFDVGSDTSKPRLKILYLYVSVIVDNINKIIKTLAPDRNEVTQLEILETIVMITFGDIEELKPKVTWGGPPDNISYQSGPGVKTHD